jgi:hypothetical protein
MGGSVGIGTTSPDNALTVVGNIWGSGNIVSLGTLTSSNISIASTTRWNTTYSTVNASSSNWDYSFSLTNASSSNWDYSYSLTNASSSMWDYSFLLTNASSSKWDWVYGIANASSSKWDWTYGTVNASNTSWNTAYNKINASSSYWDYSYSLTNASSSDWSQAYGWGNWQNGYWLQNGTTLYSTSTISYVGIGTTTPASTLGVYGTSTFMGGYVGIGTTSPEFLLDVYRTPGATSTIARFGASSSDTIVVGGGLGKITVGVWDPVYNINGTKYSTFGSGMTGMKEETSGVVNIKDKAEGKDYYHYVVDFNNLETGSDLWLFSKTTNLKQNINKLVVLLSPAGRIRAWYQVDPAQMKLIFYASRPITLSFRLTAPRFDWQEWSNLAKDAESITGYVINDDGLMSSGTEGYVFDEENNSEPVLSDTDFDLSNIVQSIKGALTSLTGDISAAGQWVFEKIFVKNAEIENLEIKNGISIYDKNTGEFYCVGIENGSLVSKKGKCTEEQLSPITNPNEGTSQNGTELSTSTEEIATTTASETFPTPDETIPLSDATSSPTN